MQKKKSRRVYNLDTCRNMYSDALIWIFQYIYAYVVIISYGYQG